MRPCYLGSWWKAASSSFSRLCLFPTSSLAAENNSLGSIEPEQFGRSNFNIFRARRANLDKLSKRLLSLSIDYLSKKTQILCVVMLFCFGWLTYRCCFLPPSKVQILTHLNSMKWLGKRVGWDDSKRILRFCKESPALEELGHDLICFDGKWNILGSQTGLFTPVLLCATPLLWELRVMPMPPQHQVSPVCPHPGSSAFWFSRGLLCDASSPKAGWIYVCTPPLRTQKTCQDVLTPIQHISVLNTNLSLEEGQPSANQQTTHLM